MFNHLCQTSYITLLLHSQCVVTRGIPTLCDASTSGHDHTCSCMPVHAHACPCMSVHVRACPCMSMHAHALVQKRRGFYRCMPMHAHACPCMPMHAHACSCMPVHANACRQACRQACRRACPCMMSMAKLLSLFQF